MRLIATATAVCACSLLSGCFVAFIPGEVVAKVSDTLTGAEGEHCVERGVTVGSLVRNTVDGEMWVVHSISGTSMRCKDPNRPIRVALAKYVPPPK